MTGWAEMVDKDFGTGVSGNTMAAFHRVIRGHCRANRLECCVPHSSMFSSCCFSAHLLLVVRLLRVSSGTPPVTNIAGSTITTSSCLAQ